MKKYLFLFVVIVLPVIFLGLSKNPKTFAFPVKSFLGKESPVGFIEEAEYVVKPHVINNEPIKILANSYLVLDYNTLSPILAKDSDKKIRVKTIRHTDCIEVGHDKFDEVITNFLAKIGEANLISITPLTYTHLDIGTQKLLTDFGVLIVYRG